MSDDLLSSVEDIVEDARNGRMFILVDHEDRENEGDLVIPAQMATPEKIAFMAAHGRGLICLAMTGAQLDRLGLPMMAATNQSRMETAFTVSIEAREGVTTGISAPDRARTIAAAIAPDASAQDIATPGHVFPLRAREGGVLVRAGHTEAAVDIARLAGLNPSGVICEIMKDDGEMARLPDLIGFAGRHGLKIGAISDLIAYRRRHDHLLRETAMREVESHGARWTLRVFRDQAGEAEHLALTMGDISTGGAVLTRMHVLDPLEDVLRLNAARAGQVPAAMTAIAAEGRGCVVMIRDLSATALTEKLDGAGASPKTLRQYGIGAEILCALGISRIELLTNSRLPKLVGLDGYGLSVVGTRPLSTAES